MFYTLPLPVDTLATGSILGINAIIRFNTTYKLTSSE